MSGGGGYGAQGYGAQTAGQGGYSSGYNPQPMPGAPYSPGPPGWDMRLGSGGQDYMTAGASRLWGPANTPPWLQLQLGQYEDQPWATNPNQYGRWNWGTNLQGHGIPSPFGQYAQQFAQYPPINFPPPPQPPGGGGGGGPPPPPPPPGGGGGGGGNPPPPGDFSGLNTQQQFLLAKQMGYNSPLAQQLMQRYGDQYNQMVNQYANASGGQYNDSAYASQLAAALNPNLPAATRAYNANLLKGTPWAQYLGMQGQVR